MSARSLTEWLAHLEQKHSQLTGKSIDLGLERVRTVAKALNLLELKTTNQTQIITVAGTNGKGSFICALNHLLCLKGLRVGAYTSPHILRFNERIQIQQQDIDDELLLQAFEQIEVVRQQLDVSLSFFEFTTLAAFYCFKQQEFDVILLEVGLGGRLDAVNIIEPDWAVITSIGLDHQDFLGDNLEKIALEKCGIIRPDSKLIILDNQPLEALQNAAKQAGSLLVERDFTVNIDFADGVEHGYQWQLNYNNNTYPKVLDNGLSMLSQAGAVILAEAMSSQFPALVFKPDELKGLSDISLAGRFQNIVLDGVTITFDVAHNIPALLQLQRRLRRRPLQEGAKRIALFTMFDDKPMKAAIELLKDDFFAWFLMEIDHPRARKPSDIAASLHAQGINMISVSKNISQAFARLKQMTQAGDEIIVFGSFITVSALLQKLGKLSPQK